MGVSVHALESAESQDSAAIGIYLELFGIKGFSDGGRIENQMLAPIDRKPLARLALLRLVPAGSSSSSRSRRRRRRSWSCSRTGGAGAAAGELHHRPCHHEMLTLRFAAEVLFCLQYLHALCTTPQNLTHILAPNLKACMCADVTDLVSTIFVGARRHPQ